MVDKRGWILGTLGCVAAFVAVLVVVLALVFTGLMVLRTRDAGPAEVWPNKLALSGCESVTLEAERPEILAGAIVLGEQASVEWRGPESRVAGFDVSEPQPGAVRLALAGRDAGEPLRFRLVCPGLVSLTAGRAAVDLDALSTPRFRLETSSGRVRLRGFTGEQLDVVVLESGDVRMDAVTVDRFSADLRGSGDLEGSGTAVEVSTEQFGSGRASLFALRAERVSVKLHGSGDAEVFATEHLSARTENSGDVTYRGAPPVVVGEALGSGRVEPRQ